MFKLFALFVFFLLSLLSPILANDVVPGSQYRTTDTVETLSGTTIDAGELVEALAASDVADVVSPSGQLLTFKYQNRIYNADFDGFERALSEHWVTLVNSYQNGAGAGVCINVSHSDPRLSVPSAGNDAVLMRYVSLSDEEGLPVTSHRLSTQPAGGGVHLLCVEGLVPSTGYHLTIKRGYPLRSCKVREAAACTDEKVEIDLKK